MFENSKILPFLQNKNIGSQYHDTLDIDNVVSYIIFCYLYSDILLFENEKEHNTFVHFLERDDVFIYALIIRSDLRQLKQSITDIVFKIQKTKQLTENQQDLFFLLKRIADYVHLLFYWYENLSEEDDIKVSLYDVHIPTFFQHINALYYIVQNFYVNFSSQEVTYFLTTVEKYITKYSYFSSSTSHVDFSDITEKNLNNYIFDAFRDAIENMLIVLFTIQETARKNFKNVLFNRCHSPIITLLISFFHVLHNNISFNSLIVDHINYYFKGILGFKLLEGAKDSVLLFGTTTNNHGKFIPKGTKVNFGYDNNGENIVFKTDKSVYINNISIKTIKVYKCNKLTLNSFDRFPECKVEFGVYDMEEVYKNRQSLYLFSSKHNTMTTLHSTSISYPFSYVFLSSLFSLNDGERNIYIHIYPTLDSIKNLLQELSHINLFTNDNVSTIGLWLKILHLSCSVFYSSASTLVRIPKNKFSFSWDSGNNAIICKITITHDMPNVTKPENDIFKCNLTTLPGIEFRLEDESLIWAYFLFFYTSTFEQVKIHVDVNNYRKLILQNDFGICDNTSSFYPFGPMAQIDTSFYIGSEEVFNKKLSNLKLHIDWDEVPKEGFKEYYKNYDCQITSSDFKVEISYLQHRFWNPLKVEQRQKVNLFNSTINHDTEQEIISDFVEMDNLNLNILGLENPVPFSFGEQSFLSKTTNSGFLRLKFVEPEVGFANDIYNNMYLSAFSKKQNKQIQDFFDLEIKTPFVPKIKNISLDYTALQIINNLQSKNDTNFKILKTYPFGFGDITSMNNAIKQKNIDDALFLQNLTYATISIAISGLLETDTFSLYIVIDSVSIYDNTKDLNSYQWLYLSNNEWKYFKDTEILSDSTNRLSTSGFVVFKTPKIHNKNNTILQNDTDENTCWIQLLILGSKMPTIINIYPNVFFATRISNNTKNKLAPYQAKEIMGNNYKDIIISQPFESFNGYEKENETDFYSRVSERLKHKDRALSPWDYKALILHYFKEIKDVQCLNCLDEDLQVYTPGTVTIIVIINRENNFSDDRIFPQASIALLKEIKNKISQHCSSFVNVNVINPYYEEIQLVFRVKFKNAELNSVYKNKLNQVICNFISPWLHDNTKSIHFGKTIKIYDLFNIIKSQEYVSIVGNLVVLKKYKNKMFIITGHSNTVFPTEKDCILYSASKHKIIVDVNSEFILDNNLSIGSAGIEEDFIIGPFINTYDINNIPSMPALQQKTIEEFYVYFLKNHHYGNKK